MNHERLYSLEQAQEEAEPLKTLSVLSALKRLGFEDKDAVEYAKIDEQITTEAKDFNQANLLVEQLNKLVDDKFGREVNQNNNDIWRLPGYNEIHEIADKMELRPTIIGKLLFKKEGHGRVFGRQPWDISKRDVAYFGFVQTDYGKFYVKLGQKQRGQQEDAINKPVTLRVYLPFRFTDKRGGKAMPSVSIMEHQGMPIDDSLPPKSAYIPWKTLLGAIVLRDNELDSIIAGTNQALSNARGRGDQQNLKKKAIQQGVDRFKDWYFNKLLKLESN